MRVRERVQPGPETESSGGQHQRVRAQIHHMSTEDFMGDRSDPAW